jgi:protein-disulfide isomerase
MKEKLLNAATVLVALVAVAAIGASLRNMLAGHGAAAAPSAFAAERVVRNGAELARAGQVMGDPAAPVKVVVFSDFQCTYCRRAARELKRIRDESGGRVAVVFRHYPVTAIHPHAAAAAAASECAAAQGRFEPFHDALFAEQPDVASEDWDRYAREAAVPDRAAFARCVQAGSYRARVQADIRAGERLELAGTPSFVVDGTLVSGADMEHVGRLVRAALQRAGG